MATLTGTETLSVIGTQPSGSPSSIPEVCATGDIANIWPNGSQYKESAHATPYTGVPANFAGALLVTLNMTTNLGGAGTINLPSAAQISAIIPTVATQSNGTGGTETSYFLRIINSSAGNFAWTVAGGGSWTLNGTMSINQNTYRDFQITLNSSTTATIQTIGTGTWS